MSTQRRIHSYLTIIDKVKDNPGISKKELLEFLEDKDLVTSLRSLDRRIDELRTDFKLQMPFDHLKKGYKFVDEDLEDIDDLLGFLEMNAFTIVSGGLLKLNRSTLKCFSFETHGRLRGVEYIDSIVNAIQNHNKISFLYQRYEPNAPKNNIVLWPLILKEYQGRWYLCGLVESAEKFLMFGLDRITNFCVLGETFIPPEINPSEIFNHVVGVTILNPEDVELEFSTYQAQYIIALPIHKTQMIIRQTDNTITFLFKIAPNYELVQRILMYGREVKVLKPESLVNWVSHILSETAKKYN